MWMRTGLLIGALLSCLSVSASEWLIDVRTAEEFSAEHVAGAKYRVPANSAGSGQAGDWQARANSALLSLGSSS